MLPQAWRPALREPVSSSARITGRLNKQATLPTAWLPFYSQGGKAAKHHGAQASGQHQGKRVPRGHPRPPACRNPGQPGDQDGLAPRRPGGISWACPLIKFLLACPETRLPGGRETRVPNGRRPGDRETGWPGWRMPGDQAARRPGDRDNFRCVIQIKSGIISNLAEKSS